MESSPLPFFSDYPHVTHLAYLIARLLGCDPVVFFGLDLCFTKDSLYTKNTQHLSHTLQKVNNRLYLVSDQGIHQEVFSTKNAEGQSIYFTESMRFYRTMLESCFSSEPGILRLTTSTMGIPIGHSRHTPTLSDLKKALTSAPLPTGNWKKHPFMDMEKLIAKPPQIDRFYKYIHEIYESSRLKNPETDSLEDLKAFEEACLANPYFTIYQWYFYPMLLEERRLLFRLSCDHVRSEQDYRDYFIRLFQRIARTHKALLSFRDSI